jgi:hypothetical protein
MQNHKKAALETKRSRSPAVYGRSYVVYCVSNALAILTRGDSRYADNSFQCHCGDGPYNQAVSVGGAQHECTGHRFCCELCQRRLLVSDTSLSSEQLISSGRIRSQ